VGFDAYDVYWNGEKYECTLVTANGEAFLGNRSLIDGAYADTGEPFVLTGWALTDKDPVLTAVKKATSDAQTVHIKVTTHAVVTYSQLPGEYMTQALPYYVDVLVSYSSDTGGYVYSCTERVERLEPMVRSGRTVRMRMTMGEDGVYQGALLCELGAYTENYGGLALVFTQVIPLLGTNMFMLAPDGAGGYVVSDEV
jgi:hypothetical protein